MTALRARLNMYATGESNRPFREALSSIGIKDVKSDIEVESSVEPPPAKIEHKPEPEKPAASESAANAAPKQEQAPTPSDS